MALDRIMNFFSQNGLINRFHVSLISYFFAAEGHAPCVAAASAPFAQDAS